MPKTQSLEELVGHFRSQPWCAALLDAPGTKCLVPSARREGDQNTSPVVSYDQVFRTALRGDNAVPYMLAIYGDPDAPDSPNADWRHRSASQSPTPGKEEGKALSLPIASLSLLLDLRTNVRGFNGNTHGGLLATAMDEAMGQLIFTNFEYQLALDDAATAAGADHWDVPPGVADLTATGLVMTAYMNVNFRKPVPVPNIVVVTATLNRIVGRKIFLDVVIKNKDGVLCSACEGMWVIAAQRPKPGKL